MNSIGIRHQVQFEYRAALYQGIAACVYGTALAVPERDVHGRRERVLTGIAGRQRQRAGAQHLRAFVEQGDNGGFQALAAGTAIEHLIQRISERGPHMPRLGGTHSTETIRRWRRQTTAECAQQGKCQGVAGRA